MNSRTLVILAAALIIVVVIIVAATLLFTPGQTEPAFQAAVAFVEAAARGDDAAALALVSPAIRDAAAAGCPEGSLSACVDAYTPPEWGDLKSVVFRRATPDGESWDVDLISYYAANRGASGVCIYARMEPVDGSWQVTRYAGFIHCADPAWRDISSNPDAPNSEP
ncbi:MAG: hypothetical protein L6Q98_12410 [Anaerolineae bacterium]|nr:hypothetical protein [Anaerolineae bacterium]NUQ06310.1 hypothetical protein [Anaerolineae bacterium]